jgi:hypothetical protein
VLVLFVEEVGEVVDDLGDAFVHGYATMLPLSVAL